jgi:Tfp pilus assembly protein PilF/peroxiredoxin
VLQHSRSDKTSDVSDGSLNDQFRTMLRQGRPFSGNERNCVFLNTIGSKNSSGRFANISAVSGLDFPDDGRAIAHVDWDEDGDLDLWITNRNAPRLRLLRNDAHSPNHFLQIGLTGNGRDTNRNAIGARVTVFLKPNQGAFPTELAQTLYGGDSFISQGTRWLHFGLGPNAEIDRVQVRWPNEGVTLEEFSGVQIDSRWELVQGRGQAVAANTGRRDLVLAPSILKPPTPSGRHRIPVVFEHAAPKVTYRDFAGNGKQVKADPGQSILVNLWSSTCRPCLAELKEFTERHEELEAAGIRIVAASIDAFDPGIENPVADSRKFAERLGLTFEVGMADAVLVDKLRQLHNNMITLESPLPLPTSFLIDPEGNLNVIYKGAVSVDTLLADVQKTDRSLVARMHDSAAFPGRLIEDPALLAPLSLEGSIVHLKIGRELMQQGKMEEALAEHLKAVEQAPGSPFAHNACGVSLSALDRLSEAVKYFSEAVRLDPVRVQFRVNLAQSLISTGRPAEAQEILEQVVAEASGHSDAHFQLGLAKLRQNDTASARTSLENAVQANPQHGQAHFTLGGLLLKLSEYAEARKHFEETLKVEPRNPPVIINLAFIALREKDLVAAEQLCKDAIALDAGYADAHYMLGMVYQAAGRFFEARQSFQTTLEYDPANVRAMEALRRL